MVLVPDSEGGVHHEADEECPQEVARGESFLCGVYEVSEPEAGHAVEEKEEKFMEEEMKEAGIK